MGTDQFTEKINSGQIVAYQSKSIKFIEQKEPITGKILIVEESEANVDAIKIIFTQHNLIADTAWSRVEGISRVMASTSNSPYQ